MDWRAAHALGHREPTFPWGTKNIIKPLGTFYAQQRCLLAVTMRSLPAFHAPCNSSPQRERRFDHFVQLADERRHRDQALVFLGVVQGVLDDAVHIQLVELIEVHGSHERVGQQNKADACGREGGADKWRRNNERPELRASVPVSVSK